LLGGIAPAQAISPIFIFFRSTVHLSVCRSVGHTGAPFLNRLRDIDEVWQANSWSPTTQIVLYRWGLWGIWDQIWEGGIKPQSKLQIALAVQLRRQVWWTKIPPSTNITLVPLLVTQYTQMLYKKFEQSSRDARKPIAVPVCR